MAKAGVQAEVCAFVVLGVAARWQRQTVTFGLLVTASLEKK